MPLPGDAVRVTEVPSAKSKAQEPLAVPPVMVQLIPAGDDDTDPSPEPPPRTVMVWVTTANVAVTGSISIKGWDHFADTSDRAVHH